MILQILLIKEGLKALKTMYNIGKSQAVFHGSLQINQNLKDIKKVSIRLESQKIVHFLNARFIQYIEIRNINYLFSKISSWP